MKKTVWLPLILMLLCVLALSACDNADTPPNNDNGQQTTDETGDNSSPEHSTVCQHTFGDWGTVKQATCKEEGKRTRTCNTCSEVEEEFIPKTEDHTIVTDAAVAATCKATGLTEGSHCAVCNKVLVAQTVINILSHTEVVDAAVAPDCENTGLTEGKHCSVCNDVLVAQTVVPKNEDHTTVIDAAVPATCKATGLTEGSHCSVCKKVLVKQTLVTIIKHSYKNGICTMCKQSEPSSSTDDSTNGANTIGGESGLSWYTSQGDWIYFASSETQISKYKKNTYSLISVYNVSKGNVRCVNVVGNWIYFYVEGSNTSSSYIAKVRTDGSEFEKILSSITVGEMLVVKDTIFFTTIKNPYSNYAKDCAPLYSISVNGGVTHQLHDGYVSSLTADATYVYFLQTLESGESTIYRVKHNGTKESVLYSNANINGFVLADSKLYFLKFDNYSEECTIASISVKGGSYTTYGKIPFYSEWLYVFKNRIYYYGSPYSANGLSEIAGIIEYDTSTKKYTVIKEDYEMQMCFFTSGCLIIENYNYITLTSIYEYNIETKAWKKISIK